MDSGSKPTNSLEPGYPPAPIQVNVQTTSGGSGIWKTCLIIAVIMVALGLLLVGVVVALIFAMNSIASKEASKHLAQTEIQTLEMACKQYKLSVGRFPGRLEDLVTCPQNMAPNSWQGPYLDHDATKIEDCWGVEYRYVADEMKSDVTLVSAGPDKQFDTIDDISN